VPSRAPPSNSPASAARALEGYPVTTKNVIAEELHVGTEATFAEAGFAVVSRPTLRRVVMRRDFSRVPRGIAGCVTM
jgi:hypothetical protein